MSNKEDNGMKGKFIDIMNEAKLEKLNEMLDLQGSNGNWNCDPYMHGLYNGMEFMLSMVEEREPVFRDAPDKWLDTPQRICSPILTFLYKFKRFYRRKICPHKILSQDVGAN